MNVYNVDLVQWLRNQYARHKEIEDKEAADLIESLRAQLAETKARLQKYCSSGLISHYLPQQVADDKAFLAKVHKLEKE